MTTLPIVKGHGTENDFVLVPDADDRWAQVLTADVVAALCHRRAGIGGDGLIRIVPTSAVAEFAHLADRAPWFMDYRNADGSVAEMCGNGARVFVRYLRDVGLEPSDSMRIATRAGVLDVDVRGDLIAVQMGTAEIVPVEIPITVAVGEYIWSATGVHIPNPHAVAFVDDLAQAGPLLAAPVVSPASAFPEGANVEFVVPRGERHVAMRVFERGSGETRSCGTGAAAVAVAARERVGGVGEQAWTIDVPGGRLVVELGDGGHSVLVGPAVLVAQAEVDLGRLAASSLVS
jgi:diaminopimelate epimerase